MKEILRGEPTPSLSHLTTFERILHRHRLAQMERIFEKFPKEDSYFNRGESLNGKVEHGEGSVHVDLWRHDGGGSGVHVTATAILDEMTGGFIGVNATEEGFIGDEMAWRISYSTFTHPHSNQLRAGEVVQHLRTAAGAAESRR